jgi:PhzF family phenazine biosynthesis protein
MIDAFSTTPFEGNPAGVVAQGGEKLSDALLQRVAREMNASETAFLLPATTPEADVRIRWFTPEVEVALCGHATIASFHAAAEEGLWGLKSDGVHHLRMECLSGILPIEVRVKAGEPAVVRMGLPDPEVRPLEDPSTICRALGMREGDIAPALPAVQCGFFVLVPARSLSVVKDLKPDMQALRSLKHPGGADGVIVATLRTFEPLSAVHLRMFAPAAGVPEDPVTGSAQGPVAGWLASVGYFGGEAGPPPAPGDPPAEDAPTRPVRKFFGLAGGRFGYTAEQGDIIGRRGRVAVELSVVAAGGAPRARDVSILGSAVTVVKGTMRVP